MQLRSNPSTSKSRTRKISPVGSTNRLEVLAKKRVEEERLLGSAKISFGQVERDGHFRPNATSASDRVGHPSRRVEGKVGSHGSRTRRSSKDGERTEATPPPESPRGAGQDTHPAGSSPEAGVSSGEEHFIPHCDEEMQEWMEDRHKDLQAALVAGQLSEVAKVSNLLTQAGSGNR